MDGKTGCGFTIQQHGTEILAGKYGLPPYTSVYQAELFAIEMAIRQLTNMSIRGPVTIHTDSLSAIQALQSPDIVSQQCLQTLEQINNYGAHNDLRIHWIKAHAGNPGNERADELAKAGTTLPAQHTTKLSVRTRKAMYRSNTYQLWNTLWQQCPHKYKRSRVWLPQIPSLATKPLLALSRNELALCT